MKNEQTFKEKTKKKIEEWKSMAEELNVQLHLGAAETKDEFEKQKKKLSIWVQAANFKVDKAKNVSQENALKLKASIEELQLQAALGKAETKEEFEVQQKNISKALQELKQDLAGSLTSIKESYIEASEKTDEKLNDFQTRFDLIRLQLHLGKQETKEVWEEKKKEISQKLHLIKSKIQAESIDVEGKLENLSNEISEKWKQIRNIK